ncbi:MAG: sugar ABC transporter permease [Lachnospiraceae bacterium]|nr:sugar ABC transporter permease [Lachnospiraceae bacterium]MDE6254111.1 sugar ABC transporter permease [Lachnospiraceae bacterium]
MKTSTKNKVLSVVVIIFLLLVTFIVLYPIVFVISAAFAPGNTATGLSIVPFSDGFTFEHFTYLFSETNFMLWFENTLIIAICTCILSVIICSLAAYVFSRFRFALKKSMLMSLLILQIFPSFVGMIAIYVIINRMGAYNQLWGLVLVYVAGNVPYNTWLVKSYLDTIPKSLDEAARIDGANHLTIFWRVVMPIAKPIIIFLGITTFTGPWMDWIFPKLVLGDDEKQTLAIGLFSFVTDRKDQFTTFAAGALLVAIPFVFFFVITQKAQTEGLGAAAVKE